MKKLYLVLLQNKNAIKIKPKPIPSVSTIQSVMRFITSNESKSCKRCGG